MRLIYAGTDTEWGDCILDYGCNTDAITPGLQATWAKASRTIEKAEQLSRLIGSAQRRVQLDRLRHLTIADRT